MSELLFARKLYAFLQAAPWSQSIAQELPCLTPQLPQLENWWEDARESCAIAQASDTLNLSKKATEKQSADSVDIRHPISGQSRQITGFNNQSPLSNWPNFGEGESQKAFWWFWRFCPELRAQANSTELLFPAHLSLPDCPQHSYQATVSALAGAMYDTEDSRRTQPYLLLFSFSPVQEFIKASRKFLDFWAGSYLLHYLAAKLCWKIAEEYGPDAVIVPSLWNQEIMDALLLKAYPTFEASFENINDGKVPTERFDLPDRLQRSLSLSTAGFPNVITALVPGKAAAETLGRLLEETLTETWNTLGKAVRKDITHEVSLYCQDVLQQDGAFKRGRKDITVPNWDDLWEEFSKANSGTAPSTSDAIPYKSDLEFWQPNYNNNQGKPLHPNWKWRQLWEHQLNYSWEPYWVAVPLGNPGNQDKTLPLSIDKKNGAFDPDWITAQNTLSNCRHTIPAPAEVALYEQLNVGSWWGSFQQRLGESLRAVKNTRVWQLPAAPGERSTLSGQFSVVHPGFGYSMIKRNLTQRDLREGAGLPEGSLRFFWFLMAKAYPGVFNGSERLNALELTKRMAWKIGGVAEDLQIKFSDETEKRTVIELLDQAETIDKEDAKQLKIESTFRLSLDYERLVRFPNLSAIASARFVHDDAKGNHQKTQQYWKQLAKQIAAAFDSGSDSDGSREKRQRFAARTRGRPAQIAKTDQAVNANNVAGQNYNGVMFSSKWLAEDMGLETPDEKTKLRQAVKTVHAELGFGDRSPSDWWVIVLADGDNMGKYVSGTRLKTYENYLNLSSLDDSVESSLKSNDFLSTRKRMGPATHVGLNRALLDFSNRLVPYLTEKRFCGRLVYSGGDDVMAMLPIEDLPGYLLSLRSAWCGDAKDPWTDQDDLVTFKGEGGYWQTEKDEKNLLPNRPLFTMGEGATMSMGIVIAHKTVPLPTVLESLWSAEKDRAKKLPGKNGLCFRVIYSGGNQLEALMNGDLLAHWWESIKDFESYQEDLAPVFYRLAEELPQRAMLTSQLNLVTEAANVIMKRREHSKRLEGNFVAVADWLTTWENWAKESLAKTFGAEKEASSGHLAWESSYLSVLQGTRPRSDLPLGTHPDDLGQLLRFTAFWIDRRVERWKWLNQEEKS